MKNELIKLKNLKIIEKLKDKRREITLISITLMVLILFTSGYSLGKGYSNISIEANAQIAEPILIVENNPAIDVTAIKNKGYYDFKIKNYDEAGKINQVELKYNIQIISDTDETVIFKIYKETQEIPIENNKTQEIILSKDIKQEDCYRLQIMYDKNKSNSIEQIVKDIQIKVHSEQIEPNKG